MPTAPPPPKKKEEVYLLQANECFDNPDPK